MKWATLIVGFISLFLAALAGFRLSTMTYDTQPLFELGLSSRDSSAAPARAGADGGKSGDGTDPALVEHLRGNSWEKDSKGGAGTTTEGDYERAEQVQEGRQEDLDGAKERIRSRAEGR